MVLFKFSCYIHYCCCLISQDVLCDSRQGYVLVRSYKYLQRNKITNC